MNEKRGRTDWFTADLHLGHANVIRHCNRPFKKLDSDGKVIMEPYKGKMRAVVDLEKHDQTLIDNINAVVAPDDTLYHLGDFSFGESRKDKTNNAQFYLNRIKCKNIIAITGNHDPHYDTGQARIEFARLFKACYDRLRIKVFIDGNRQEIVLDHYAMRVWNKSHHGVWHLYGHSHSSLPDNPNSLSFDVGVDCHGFKPLNLQQISAIMAKKTWRPVDHHGRDQVDEDIASGFVAG